MENLFDLLIPLIFIAVFLFNGLFKSNKKQPDKPSDGNDPDEAEMDPLAELREEIRRRVEASQRSEAPVQQQREPTSVAQPAPTVQAPKSVAVSQRRSEQAPSMLDAQQRDAAERMRKMQQMQDEVKAMQRRAGEAQRQASNIRGGDAWKRKDTSSRSFRRYQRSELVRDVMRDLREPGSSRKAVLNAEILGTPIGLRRPSQSQALWGG